MKVNIDFGDLSLLVRSALDTPASCEGVERGVEFWTADLHGLIVKLRFDNQTDEWLIRTETWGLRFRFDIDAEVEDAAPLPPNAARFGVWGLVQDARFSGEFTAYQNDMTLLKVVLARPATAFVSRSVPVRVQ